VSGAFATDGEPTPWVRRLAETPRAERARLLQDLVVGEFRSVMLLTDDEPLHLDESYVAQGLTSLGATEIEQRLESVIGRGIDAAQLLNNPTVTRLLDHLRSDVLAEFFAPAGPLATAAPAARVVDATRAREEALVGDLLADLYRP